MKYIFLFIFAACICSCNFDKANKKSNKIRCHEIVEIKNDFIGKGGFFIVNGKSIVGLEESSSYPAFYTLKNDGTENMLMRFADRGQGPNEVLHPLNMQYLDNGTIGFYDAMKRSYCYMPLPQENEKASIGNCVKFDKLYFRVIHTAYNHYVALSTENGLLSMFDAKGEHVDDFFEYPYKDNFEKNTKNSRRAFAYQGSLVANPSATKCVYAPMNGDIIHFYGIREKDVTLIHKSENAFVDYSMDEKGVITNSNTISGYISLAATEKYVYALFCGKPLKEIISNNSLQIEGDIVRIFDWNGKKIDEITLDVPCSNIGTSDDKILWAVARTPEISFVRFDMDRASDAISPKWALDDRSSKWTADAITAKKANSETTISPASLTQQNKDSVFISHLRDIYLSETSTLAIIIKPYRKILSIETASKDITFKERADYTQILIMDCFITKERLGDFSDTVIVKFEDKHIQKHIIRGKVVKR